MTAEIIHGEQLAKQLRENMKDEIKQLQEKGIHPKLTVILIGDDPASHSYVKGKNKASEEVGIDSEIIRMEATITEEQLINKINELNNDDSVHGILVQLPIPKHIDEQKIIET